MSALLGFGVVAALGAAAPGLAGGSRSAQAGRRAARRGRARRRRIGEGR
jgi:hypothetical protein